MNPDRINEVPELIGRLYDIVKALQEIFKVRPFTPDGHLVGSLGEAVAAYLYDLRLEDTCVTAGVDARTKHGNQTVEIKLTAINKVQISADGQPEILLVFKLDQETGFSEIYNGPLPTDLMRKKKPNKRRVISLTLPELRKTQSVCANTPDQKKHISEIVTVNP